MYNVQFMMQSRIGENHRNGCYKLGRRQAVSHRVLIPAFAGSIPAVLDSLHFAEVSES